MVRSIYSDSLRRQTSRLVSIFVQTTRKIIVQNHTQNYQSSVKAPDILYKLALVLTKIDKNLEACNTLIKFQQEYSDNKFMDKTSRKIKELECE